MEEIKVYSIRNKTIMSNINQSVDAIYYKPNVVKHYLLNATGSLTSVVFFSINSRNIWW